MSSPDQNRFQTLYLSAQRATVGYEQGLRQQSLALARLEAGSADAVILGLEHPTVVTLGVRGRAALDLETAPAEMSAKGIQVHEVGRGGQATVHSPGQLVVYPCVNLRAYGLGARAFVETVESSTIECLARFGVSAQADPLEPGLFVTGAKIAAFGFKIAHGLTSHGLAINISNDLSYFDQIRTCGVSGQKVTRLLDLGVDLDPESVFSVWVEIFRTRLQGQAVREKIPAKNVDDSRGVQLV